ncbi:MAG TPA: hypothetical protein VFG87_22315 [Amycolatopsis sp.]|jgi:hypothetical protein|nr:hypothetical protein [Amycolatopsis sp.]
MTDDTRDGSIISITAAIFGGDRQVTTMAEDADRMLDDARAGKWAVDEETGTHLRQALVEMQQRIAAISSRIHLVTLIPKLGNDAYALTAAQHFHAAMDSDDQSLIPILLQTDHVIDKLRMAIETASRNYDASDEFATRNFGPFKD